MEYERQGEGPKRGCQVCFGSSRSPAVTTWMDFEAGQEEQGQELNKSVVRCSPRRQIVVRDSSVRGIAVHCEQNSFTWQKNSKRKLPDQKYCIYDRMYKGQL